MTMKSKTLLIIALTLFAGLAIGYFFGYDHGWEKAAASLTIIP